MFGYFKEYWANWKAVKDRIVDIGDGVMVFGHYEGTFKATGKFVKAAYATEYKIRDGKITQYNQYTDTYLISEAMKSP